MSKESRPAPAAPQAPAPAPAPAAPQPSAPPARPPGEVRTFDPARFTTGSLLQAKTEGQHTVSVCIPARDEESTVGAVVEAVRNGHQAAAGGSGLVDEVLVIDDGSADGTRAAATKAGARVLTVHHPGPPGKGQALQAGLDASTGDLVVFLDADVEDTTALFVAGLLGPLLLDRQIALVKGFYDRPIDGAATGGGRVTELVARPLIDLLFDELAGVRQPLAGETAAHRHVLEAVGFSDGYGIELGMLVDVARRYGVGSIAQVDLGIRTHRNRPLSELRLQATEILRAALRRAAPELLGEPRHPTRHGEPLAR